MHRWADGVGRRTVSDSSIPCGRARGVSCCCPIMRGGLVTANSFPRTLPGDPADGVKIYVIPAEGGSPAAMESGPWGEKAFAFATPQWSPDSRLLLRTAVHPNLKQAAILVNDRGQRQSARGGGGQRRGMGGAVLRGLVARLPAVLCLPASGMAGRTCISFRKTAARRAN